MHKWVVEQWREGECVKRLEFMDDMIQRQNDGTVVIVFPPNELVGGLTLVTNDELHLHEADDGES